MLTELLQRNCRIGLILAAVTVPLAAAAADPCPREIGRWPYGPAEAVASDGDLVYFGSGSTLQIRRLVEPDFLEIVSEVDLGGVPNEIAVVGDHLIVAAGYAGLRIVDVADPDSPVVVGSTPVRGSAVDVVVVDETAWVAAFGSGVRVFDIGDVTKPTQIGAALPGALCTSLSLDGDILWVATLDRGIHAISTKEAIRPRSFASIEVPWAVIVEVVGDHAFVVFDFHDLTMEIYDVGDPVTPRLIGSFGQPYGIYCMVFDGTIAYLGGYGVLSVVDMSDPARPIKIGSVPELHWSPLFSLGLTGQRLIAAGLRTGLNIYDVSDPSQPEPLASEDVPDGVSAVAAIDSYTLALSTSTGQLTTVDVSNPANPTFLGEVNGPDDSFVSEMVVVNEHAFAHGGWDILVFDLRDPAEPAFVEIIDGVGAYGVAAGTAADTLLVPTSGGLSIFDVSRPDLPTEIGRIDLPNAVYDVVADGDYAFLAGKDTSMTVVSLANPRTPTVVSQLPGPTSWGVAVIDSTAYLALAWDGLLLADVSDPTNPFEIAQFTDEATRGIVRHEDRAIVVTLKPYPIDGPGCFIGGHVLDVSESSNPLHCGSFCIGSIGAVAPVGGLVAVGNASDGLSILDLDTCVAPNPRNPGVAAPTIE